MFFIRLTLFVLPFFSTTALAGDHLRRGHIPQNVHRRASNTTFNLKDLYEGQAFFEYG